jgi:hypothetical protein
MLDKIYDILCKVAIVSFILGLILACKGTVDCLVYSIYLLMICGVAVFIMICISLYQHRNDPPSIFTGGPFS